MLLKKPPQNMIFYNYLGRFILIILNFVWIILFNKYFEKGTYVDKLENNDYSPEKNGRDSEPWPSQAVHLFEKKPSQLSHEFFIKIEKDYLNSTSLLLDQKKFEDSEWWKSCRQEFNDIFFANGKINMAALENFRNSVKTKAEILNDQNFLKADTGSRLNKIKAISLINLYHKLSSHVSLEILRMTSDSIIGNNFCLNYRGQRINQRILRYAYYLSQIKRNTSLQDEKRNIFLDIGGGYGGLSRLLKNYYNNSTFVIIELPELCLLSSYFLYSNFPSKKIGTFSDFKNLDRLNSEDLLKYDFVILPQNFMEKFNDEIFDLIVNTTSLGEMSDIMQDYYLQNLERCTKKYFYSVNRSQKRVEKYNSRGFYDFKFKKRWRSLVYKYSHTYHIEFLGKKIK